MSIDLLSDAMMRSYVNEGMKVLLPLMDSYPKVKGNEYTITQQEVRVILRERMRQLLISLTMYLSPKATHEEINAIRCNESVLANTPRYSPDTDSPTPPPPELPVTQPSSPTLMYCKTTCIVSPIPRKYMDTCGIDLIF
jgi:hypothetical protein